MVVLKTIKVLHNNYLEFFESDADPIEDAIEETAAYMFNTKSNSPDFEIQFTSDDEYIEYKLMPAKVTITIFNDVGDNLWVRYGHSQFTATLSGNTKDQLIDILDGYMAAPNGNGNGNQTQNGGRRIAKKYKLRRTKRRRVRHA